MNSAENNNNHKARMSYQLDDNEIALSASSLANDNSYSLSPMKSGGIFKMDFGCFVIEY